MAAGLLPGGATVDPDRRLVSAPVADRMAALTEAVRALQDAGVEAEDIALRRPTLDEVFLHLTGPGQKDAEERGHMADRSEVTA